MDLLGRDAEIEAGWSALGYQRNPQHDVFIADGINRLRATHSEDMEMLRDQLQGAVEALREIAAWVEIETSDGGAKEVPMDGYTASMKARFALNRLGGGSDE